jgi:hypothetical protein
LKLLLPAFFATGAFAFNITPFLTCVAYDPAAGMTTAYFGYESFEQSIITIPVGSNNRITPDPPNRNQPTLFFPGYFEKAFRVTFPASSAVFLSFNGFAIPANSNSAACPATTNTAPTPALPPATAGVPYSQQLRAIGGQAGVSRSAVGPLPSGLGLSPTGLLSGIPLAPGQSPLTIQATDGITTSQHTYSLLIANGVTIDDAVSTRAPGFTPQFRVVTTVAATITAAAACDATEFIITGGGTCTVPNSNTVMGRVAASEPVSNA